MKNQSTYPLRLPRSVKAEVERRAKEDGTSVNQFIATAVAEKLAVMNTAAFFAERRARADFKAFAVTRRERARAPLLGRLLGAHRQRDQSNHVLAQVGRNVGVVSQCRHRAWRRQSAAVLGQRFGIERERFRGVAQGFVDIVAG
jgi:hypothetical protein